MFSCVTSCTVSPKSVAASRVSYSDTKRMCISYLQGNRCRRATSHSPSRQTFQAACTTDRSRWTERQARTPAYAARGPIIVLYKMTCKQALCPIIMRYIGPLWLAMSDNMCCIMGLRALQVRSVMLTKEAAARPAYPYLPAAVEED